MENKKLIRLIFVGIGFIFFILSLIFPILIGTSGSLGDFTIYLYGMMDSEIEGLIVILIENAAIGAIVLLIFILGIICIIISFLGIIGKKKLLPLLGFPSGILLTILFLIVMIVGPIVMEHNLPQIELGTYMGLISGCCLLLAGLVQMVLKE